MIIDVDDFKSLITDYIESDPASTNKVHSESGRLADSKFEEELKTKKYSELLIICGGSASGKTEFAHSFYEKEDSILIFIITLKNIGSVSSKLSHAYKQHIRKISILIIVPDNIEKCFYEFKQRVRQIDENVFFDTHTNAPKAFLLLKDKYSDHKYNVNFLCYQSVKKVLNEPVKYLQCGDSNLRDIIISVNQFKKDIGK